MDEMKAARILETCLYASDLAAAEEFYTRVLGLKAFAREAGRHVFFHADRGVFLVFNPAATRHAAQHLIHLGIPFHGADGPGHAAFAMRESEIAAWREHLVREGVVIESELDWPTGGHSIYFRDPAGNSLELATPKLWGLAEE